MATSLIEYAIRRLPRKLSAFTIDTGHMLNVPTAIEIAESDSGYLLSSFVSS